MKRSVLILFLTILGLTGYSQTGIGTSTPDTSAILDVSSTTTGFLPPRMTYAQMSAIASPAEGLMVYCIDCDPKSIYYFDGTDFMGMGTGVVSAETPVSSPTGRIWMDRNLGATQIATSSTDAASYGNLYQWGRAADGHELRTSGNTSTLATTSVPDLGNAWDGMFITSISSPFDWLSPQDDNLWQGTGGTNNPCPEDYRLPTSVEWDVERLSWSTQNAAGAFASSLKLPLSGVRFYSDGTVYDSLGLGYYWSSTVNGSSADYLDFSDGAASIENFNRANGISVRCIKD